MGLKARILKAITERLFAYATEASVSEQARGLPD